MTAWLNLTDDQRRTSLAQAEYKSGIIPVALEKDWWVTLTLKALFQTEFAKAIVFKGGTSLSKCWKLINRFSEDIDIILAPELFELEYQDSPTASYIKRLKRTGCAFTSNKLKAALIQQFAALGIPDGMLKISAGEVRADMPDKDPQEIFIEYPSLYDPNPYLQNVVKIEASVRSKLEPYTDKPINSLLHEYFANDAYAEEPFFVQAIEPRKTFLEKTFLLHELFNRGELKGIKTDRLSRHFHDLAMMMRAGVAEQALADPGLYEAIVEHRRHYTNLRGVDYDLLYREHIDFCPPAELLDGFKADYQTMLEHMIYGDAPSGAELFEIMLSLRNMFRRA